MSYGVLVFGSGPSEMKEEDEDYEALSRVERSLKDGYWNFPMEPTSTEIRAALMARDHNHYEDGYPENLVSLNRFFVMHKVGYRNGKGVKLEGWKTYDDHLMTKTSSGPLNGNESLVLRIFALRPVVKGVEPIKLCWVKELSKGHQSGRRKKYHTDDDNNPNKKLRIGITQSPFKTRPPSPLLDSYPHHDSHLAHPIFPPFIPANHPNHPNQLAQYSQNPQHSHHSPHPHPQSSPNLMATSRQDSHDPTPPAQQELAQLSPLSPLSKYNSLPLPGLHVTLAGLFNLPPLQDSSAHPSSPLPPLPSPHRQYVKSEPGSPPRHASASTYRSPTFNPTRSPPRINLTASSSSSYLSPHLPPMPLSPPRHPLSTVPAIYLSPPRLPPSYGNHPPPIQPPSPPPNARSPRRTPSPPSTYRSPMMGSNASYLSNSHYLSPPLPPDTSNPRCMEPIARGPGPAPHRKGESERDATSPVSSSWNR